MTKRHGISMRALAALFACSAIAGCGGDPQPPAPCASDTVVSFRIDGVDTETAKSFYAETLPGLGYADTHNANLAIARYEGNGVKILVQDEQTGSARVTITKPAG